tara:strand:+ start:241 stop:1896 length:1656 start_codon:yes stop_codon:yes gene_type:complete
MKFKYLILSLVILIFLISACLSAETPTGQVIKEPVCNKPYILVGNDCCLDKDDNSICDTDEKTETIEDEVVVEKKISEKTETINEVKQHDIYVFGKEGFDPKELTINDGDKVSWMNEGYRSMILLIYKDGEQYLNQGSINSGDSFTHEFNEVGSYDIYWNVAHGPIKGKLIVQDRALGVVEEYVEEPIKKDDAKKSEYYTEEQLVEDLIDILNVDYYNFTRDKSYPEYIRSSDLKYYVIHTQDEDINDVQEFCDEYCAGNWGDWKYFINTSRLEYLTPILGGDNFSSDAKYREYRQEMSLINHTFIETSYDVENGKVLEYQFISWQQDVYNTFEGAWFGTFLIYKVYCSPNMTVFLRPKWDEFNDILFPVATMSSTYRTWVNFIKPLRKELLDQANDVLGRCPVEKSFFDKSSFPDYFKSEMLSYHWRIRYMYFWNMTSSIEIGVEPSTEEGKYLLKEINVSFTNNDERSINEEIALRITVNPDDKGEEEYHDGGAGGKLATGKSVKRSMRKKNIEFLNNITIEVKLYTVEDKGDIRPLKITFTKADLGFE